MSSEGEARSGSRSRSESCSESCSRSWNGSGSRSCIVSTGGCMRYEPAHESVRDAAGRTGHGEIRRAAVPQSVVHFYRKSLFMQHIAALTYPPPARRARLARPTVRPGDRQPRRVDRGAPRPLAATHARPTTPRDRPAARRAPRTVTCSRGPVGHRGAPTPPAAHGARPSLVRADDRAWPKSVHCTHSSRVHARHDRRRTSRYWWVMSARPEPPFWCADASTPR